MLDMTLATRFVPGTNLRRKAARAAWVYLLPSLELGRVLCIGAPRREALAAVARRARRVAVACVTRRDLRERARARGTPELRSVEWLERGEAGVSEAARWADVVVLAGDQGRQWLSGGRERAKALQRILERGGLAYLENVPHRDVATDGQSQRVLFQHPLRFFRLLPSRGEVRLAVPEGDRETFDRFLRSQRARHFAGFGLRDLVRELLSRLLAPWPSGPRYGMLVGGSTSSPAGQPPEYLCTLARRSGVALEDYRWGLSLPDAYGSRKLIFHLFAPRPSLRSYVVKMVSDPSFNDRLENEARSLGRLQSLGVADEELAPHVVFTGHHAGLALVGETLIDGVPFRQRSQGGPTCPHAARALDGIFELGGLAGQARVATGADVASGMGRLLDLFDQIFPDRDVTEFMRQQVEALGRHANGMPLVFQHGDPGCWNLLVTPSGRVAFLDWEAAEEAGLPLWDLFYFLRSYGVLSAPRHWPRATLRAFVLAFLEDSDLARWVRTTIARYCGAVGVEQPLVEPLFYTCWMHRSIKEATRLAPRDLNNGHYLNLLRLSIRKRESLRRLFSLAG